MATTGNDTISGDAFGNLIDGLAGNDVLLGGAGNDTLIGGPGNDNLNGQTDNDTYRFSSGFGADTINSDSGGTDVIEFTGGITPAMVLLWGSGRDLYIQIAGTTDQILVRNQLYGDVYDTVSTNRIESVRFANGTVWNLVAGLPSIGTDLGQVMIGSNGNDTIDGRGGNDSITGDAGNDVIIGGAGDDSLNGQGGNDTYRFAPGFGNDTIEGDTGGVDAIEFTAGVLPDQALLWRNGNDLFVGLSAPDSVVKVTNQFLGEGGGPANPGRMESVRFANGTIWDLAAGLVSTGTDAGQAMQGTKGNDRIDGRGGNDSITAGDGNDTLIGGAGDDNLNAELGDDVYRFGAGFGNDTINLDSGGNDTIEFLAGITPDQVALWGTSVNLVLLLKTDNSQVIVRNQLYGDAFNTVYTHRIETVRFADNTVWDLTNGLKATGTDDSQVMDGTNNGDRIDGVGGNDTISGDAGNDTLIGGAGDDSLNGQAGNDVYQFAPGFGNDTIAGDAAGSDAIALTGGVTADDLLLRIEGNDLFVGLTGLRGQVRVIDQFTDSNGQPGLPIRIESIRFDNGTVIDLAGGLTSIGSDDGQIMDGTGSGDLIDGRGGNDTIGANGGNDTVIGGAGDDNLNGGDGDDVYRFAAGFGNDTINFDSGGIDTIELPVGVTPDQVFLWGENTDLYLQLAGGERIQIRGQLLDTTSGTNVDNEIEFVRFSNGVVWNLLTGLTSVGTDDGQRMDGSNANDTIDGRQGDDSISGAGGDDVLTGAAGKDTVNGGLGNDTVRGGSDNDLLFGGPGEDSLDGGTGNDTLYGEDGNDSMQGNSGDDWLYGGAGNDTLYSGPGNDTMIGGPGDDSYEVTTGADLIVEAAGGGVDTLLTTINLTLGEHIENAVITTAAGANVKGNADANRLEGSTGNDTLRGAGGEDTLAGGNGNDRLEGGVQADLLHGGDGKDTLVGGDGHDTLVGGLGADRLNGGDGDDLFRLEALNHSQPGARDTIVGFQGAGVVGGDRIDLSPIDPFPLTQGDQKFTFRGTDPFNNVAQVRIVDLGADTLIQINLDANTATVEAEILVQGIDPDIKVWIAEDFIL